MPVIALDGMRFYAHHGFYKEEEVIGNEYVVDIHITTSFKKAAEKDDLYETINYETVYLICEAAMRRNSKLLEAVADRITQDLKHQFKTIEALKVTVKKLNPPLGGRVDCARVEMEGNYAKKCIRCTRPVICYKDNTCWCMDTLVFRKTLEQLKTDYGDGCLCRDCLEFFAGGEKRPALKE